MTKTEGFAKTTAKLNWLDLFTRIHLSTSVTLPIVQASLQRTCSGVTMDLDVTLINTRFLDKPEISPDWDLYMATRKWYNYNDIKNVMTDTALTQN